MNAFTRHGVAFAVLAAACTQPGAASSRQNTVCELFESSDSVGRFELVSRQNMVDQFGLTPTTLRMIAPIASRPVHEVETLSAGTQVAARLALPDGVRGAGSQVIVFLTWSPAFSTWADFNGQGVFFEKNGGWANGLLYAEAPVSEAELLAGAVRDGGCERGRPGERTDGGP